MGKNEERRGEHAWIKNAVFGTLCGCVVTVILAAVIATGIDRELVPEGSLKLMAVLSCLIGATVGGIVGGRRNKTRTLIVGISVGGLMAAIRLIAKMIGGEGQVLSTATLLALAACITGGILGGLMAAKRRKKRK